MTCWQAWAPPLDPPTAGGLALAGAETIAQAWWEHDPHLAAALMWEAYAATLPPAPAPASVSTGVQQVVYSRGGQGGQLGAALARAEWHRSFTSAVSVPLLRGRAARWAA
jgi:hypothetical protein